MEYSKQSPGGMPFKASGQGISDTNAVREEEILMPAPAQEDIHDPSAAADVRHWSSFATPAIEGPHQSNFPGTKSIQFEPHR